MKPSDLPCWKCGTSLAQVLLPLSRLATCKKCNADLHVCRMCRFYDTTVSNSCSEPVAEKVTDKQHKNFCGYFQPDPGAHRPVDTGKNQSAKSKLDALFGTDPGSTGQAARGEELPEAEASRRRLEELFGLKKDK